MALSGSMAASSTAIMLAPFNVRHNPFFAQRLQLHTSISLLPSVAFPEVKGHQEWKALSLRVGSAQHLLGSCTPILRVMQPTSPVVGASSKSFKSSSLQSKPRWWMRTFGCIPYLMPLHEAWLYAGTAYRLYPYLASFRFLVEPFLHTLAAMPKWSSFVLVYLVYFGALKRKELPQFLRFHLVMAFLLSLSLQMSAIVCRWMPDFVFQGGLAYFWIAVAVVQMSVVLRCMQCALGGKDADIPFMSEAANINLKM